MSSALADALAAAADRLGDDATPVLARLATPLGATASASLAALRALDEPTRRRRRAEHAALARAASPQSLRMIHPTWIEAALASLPPRAREALAGSASAPVDIWLVRFATASLPPMPVTPHTDRERLVARDPASLVAWLDAIAADQVALALGRPTHHRDLGPRRAAITRCRGLSLEDASALHVIAGRALAPHLSRDSLTLLQLTRRMPHAIGTRLEATVISDDNTPLDQAPPWSTLLAY